MSLRTALSDLPDDRATMHAVHEVIASFVAHPREPLDVARLARATGLERDRIEPVLLSLTHAVVLDCDGDPSRQPCTFDPGPVLQLEVERFMRSSGTDTAKVQSSIGRFRSRLGRD